MDRGSVAEFASPAELLRDHKSKFYGVGRAVLGPIFQVLCQGDRAYGSCAKPREGPSSRTSR